MKKKRSQPAKRAGVPELESTCAIGKFAKIHTITALTDSVGTLGTVRFSSDTHTIDVCLNVGYPGIRAAAISLDQQSLNCYISEMCQMGANQIRCESGAWPWPHEDWPEFVAACDSLGRNIRDLAARSQVAVIQPLSTDAVATGLSQTGENNLMG